MTFDAEKFVEENDLCLVLAVSEYKMRELAKLSDNKKAQVAYLLSCGFTEADFRDLLPTSSFEKGFEAGYLKYLATFDQTNSAVT